MHKDSIPFMIKEFWKLLILIRKLISVEHINHDVHFCVQNIYKNFLFPCFHVHFYFPNRKAIISISLFFFLDCMEIINCYGNKSLNQNHKFLFKKYCKIHSVKRKKWDWRRIKNFISACCIIPVCLKWKTINSSTLSNLCTLVFNHFTYYRADPLFY